MGLIERIFKKKGQTVTRAALINETSGRWSTWSGSFTDNDIFAGAVDSIARNCSKLKGGHFISYADHQKTEGSCALNRILRIRPNKYMTAADFLYKMAARTWTYNNAFALLDRDERGGLRAIYPITETGMDFLSDNEGNLYCRFTFSNGTESIFPYSEIIHTRRHFNSADFLGDNNGAITPALELATAENDSMINGMKSAASIRGVLEFTQLMSADTMKAEKEQFIQDYLSMANDGGVVATDTKYTYKPIDSTPTLLNADQTNAIAKKIYNYLGISENIVNSSYTEDEYSAFYESVIEPFALQLSLEFTAKIFTQREIAYGNEILFDSGRMNFSNNKTKIELVKQLMPLGVLSLNQALEVLNLPPVPDGDKRIQSLNYANNAIVDDYQIKKSEGSET